MFKFKYFRWTLLLLLFLFVILSLLNVGVAEFYSRSIYPALSYVLSALSSVVPFSLDEIGILLMILSVVVFPFVWRIRRKLKWRTVLLREAEMLLWIYVWFYIGWGINYYRESFFTRAGVSPAKYDEQRFKDFLYSYTDSLNRYCCNIDTVSAEHVHEEIKLSYKKVSDIYGLTTPRSFQHPKTLLFNSIYSGSGGCSRVYGTVLCRVAYQYADYSVGVSFHICSRTFPSLGNKQRGGSKSLGVSDLSSFFRCRD